MSNEERVDAALRILEPMSPDVAFEFAAFDDGAGEHRHAHVGGDAADDAIERTELETGRARPAKFSQDLLEALPVGAARPED
jgi:hypothetical protein